MLRAATTTLLLAWTGLTSLSAEARPLAPASPAASAADMPPLAELLARTGWDPTPELSGIFRTGSVFSTEDGRHSLMAEGCFVAAETAHTYTSLEVVRQLQAGVSVRAGFGRAKVEGELVKRLRFGAPQHHAVPRLALDLTPDCAARLAQVPAGQRRYLYAVHEVLTAEIAEQTCGRLDASGRFVGLGAADAELAVACAQVSLEPVAVGMRTVPLDALSLPPPLSASPSPGPTPGCPWGRVETVSSTMTTLTINGHTRDVRGLEARTAVATDLQRCGYPEAARAFERWRAHRRATNIAGATLVGMWPFGVGLYAAWQAGLWRERTEALLLDPGLAEGERARWATVVRGPAG